MRRILVPNLSAILQCLKTKLIHDIKVSLWQPANAVGTKCHIFQKNECWISLQHLWKTISVQTSLYDHNLAVHTEVESPCNLCDRSFKSKKKLRYHITSTHAEKEAFNCDIKSDGVQCIYYSTTNSNLRAHKNRVHEKPINTNLAKHVCNLCDYKTTKKFNLDKHGESCQKSLELNSIDHTCDLGQKTFPSKKSLNRHSKLHNKSKSETPSSAASCVVCKKTFVNMWNMGKHKQKEHHGTPKQLSLEINTCIYYDSWYQHKNKST